MGKLDRFAGARGQRNNHSTLSGSVSLAHTDQRVGLVWTQVQHLRLSVGIVPCPRPLRQRVSDPAGHGPFRPRCEDATITIHTFGTIKRQSEEWRDSMKQLHSKWLLPIPGRRQ